MTLRVKVPIRRRPRPAPPKLYIGPWIRRLGLKQVDVARAASIGESHMTLIIKGERYPSPGTLRLIAQAMGISEMELRAPPPDEDLIRAASAISPETLAKLGRHLRKTDD